MKLISLVVLALLVFTANSLYAQKFDVPKNYKLVDKEDYAKYEQDIINAAKWLRETPFDQQTEKRRKVSAFVVKWVNGSPTVNVELNANILDFDKKNPGMLVLYMASCARYVLENQDFEDMRAKHKYALRDMIYVYQRGEGIKKDKKMEKLIKMEENDQLDEWLEENLKVGDH